MPVIHVQQIVCCCAIMSKHINEPPYHEQCQKRLHDALTVCRATSTRQGALRRMIPRSVIFSARPTNTQDMSLTSWCVFAEADDCDAVGELDEDAVVVEDHSEAEDSDAVMVDALEALRLTQPHMAHASSTGYYAPHADENQRPQTATGSRHVSDDSSFANGGPADKWHHPSKGFSPSGRRSNNRMVPCGDGSMWAMFGRGRKDDSDCNGVTHEFGGNSTLVQLGLQSRLAEAAEDMHSFADEGGEGCQSQDTTFSSAQYWKTPLAIPQDIENA